MKREVAGNTFQDGLQMDMNDFSKSNSTLASCLNGTFVTFNGNEYVLQNDLGNGRVETAYLPENYVPLGTASYGGIIYIVSYNPKDNKCQIGSFPSPERNISSDEIGSEKYSLSTNDFIHNEVVDTFVVEKKLGDTLYSPGDFFLVTGTNLSGNIDQIFDPNGNNSVKTTLKLSLGSTSEDGKVTILTGLKTYTISNQEGTITKKLILAPQNNIEEGQSPTVEEYRSVISQPYNVFSSKERGKLVLIAELLCCDSFTISVKNNITHVSSEGNDTIEEQVSTLGLEDGPTTTPPITDITNYYSPIISYEFNGNNYVPSGVHIKVTSYDNSIIYNGNRPISKQFISSGEKTGNIELQNLLELPKDINSSKVITIEVTPIMNWGEAIFLKQTKTIDLSKIGTGAIELSQWKYYNDSSKCTIQWALNTYLEETQYIDNISMTFKRITDFQGEETNRTYTTEELSYVISKKSDYNSTFYENIPLDTEYYKLTNTSTGETGILVSDKLYLATIIVTKKDTEDPTFSDGQEFYRWILTNSMFNDYYKIESDFNNLDLSFQSEIVGSLKEIGSAGSPPNEQEYQTANTYLDLDPSSPNVPSSLDSLVLTLKQYHYRAEPKYELSTKLIGGNLFNCNISDYSQYIDNNITKKYQFSGDISSIGTYNTNVKEVLNTKEVEVGVNPPTLSNYSDNSDQYGNGIRVNTCTITNNTISIDLCEQYLFKAACDRKNTSVTSNGTFVPLVYNDRTLYNYNLIIKNNHIIPYMIGSFAFKEGGGDEGSLYVSKFYNTIEQPYEQVEYNGKLYHQIKGPDRTKDSYSKVKKENNLYIEFNDPDFVKGTQIQGWQGNSMFVTLEGMRIIDSGQKWAYIRFKSKDQANENWLYTGVKTEPKPVFMSDPCTYKHVNDNNEGVTDDVLLNTNVVLVAIKDRDTDVYYPINFGVKADYTAENYNASEVYADRNNIQTFTILGEIRDRFLINYTGYFQNSSLLNFYKTYAILLNNMYRFDNNPIIRSIITPNNIYYYKNWKFATTFSLPIKQRITSISGNSITIEVNNKQLDLSSYVSVLKENTQAKEFEVTIIPPKEVILEYSSNVDFSIQLREKLLNQQVAINKTAILGFDGSTFIGWSDTPTDDTAIYCRKTEKVNSNSLRALPEIDKAIQFKPIWTLHSDTCTFYEPNGNTPILDSGNANISQNLIPFLAIKDGQLVLKNPTSGLELERVTSGDNGIVDGFQQNIGFSNQYRPFKPLLNTE